MSSLPDTLLDRMKLKHRLRRWQLAAIVFGMVAGAVLLSGRLGGVEKNALGPLQPSFIARIEVNDIILEDRERIEILDEMADNDAIKAVILRIDSPGGSVVGGETLYDALKRVAAKKPVVTVMGTVAASGAYMAAMGTNYIFAHQGTITGSIGVLFQSAEVTELAKKLGVEFITLKSAPLKASPSPFEKLTPEAAEAVQSTITDTYNMFVDIVADGRKNLSREQITTLADGRVYTGRQALQDGLVDAIGGEQEAITWLQKEKHIDSSLKVEDVELHRDHGKWKELLSSVKSGGILGTNLLSSEGLVALWQPSQ